MSPTLVWKNLAGRLKNDTTFTVFALEDLFSETSNSDNNMSQKGKSMRGLQSGAHLTAEGWKALFKEVHEETTPLALTIEGEKIRCFGVRLTMTDPDTVFVGGVIWQLGGLLDPMDTCVWVGAYLHVGAPWKNPDNWPSKQRFSTKLAADLTMADGNNDITKEPPQLTSTSTTPARTTPASTTPGLKSSFASSTKKSGSTAKLRWSVRCFFRDLWNLRKYFAPRKGKARNPSGRICPT